jgi:hypothetical protein
MVEVLDHDEGGPMGLFSRKANAPTPVRGDDFYESDGRVLLGSAGEDMDAETDVVGESQYRDNLLLYVTVAEREGEDLGAGRLDYAFQLRADGPRLVVHIGPHDLGYVEDSAADRWLERVREWQGRGLTVMCAGVILWNPRLGDPRESEDVPVGVRLDLVDQS